MHLHKKGLQNTGGDQQYYNGKEAKKKKSENSILGKKKRMLPTFEPTSHWSYCYNCPLLKLAVVQIRNKGTVLQSKAYIFFLF